MFDLRKTLPEGKSLTDLSESEQANLQSSITEAITAALQAGCDRLIAKSNGDGGYSTLFFALMPNEPYTCLDGEVVINVPTEVAHDRE